MVGLSAFFDAFDLHDHRIVNSDLHRPELQRFDLRPHDLQPLRKAFRNWLACVLNCSVFNAQGEERITVIYSMSIELLYNNADSPSRPWKHLQGSFYP